MNFKKMLSRSGNDLLQVRANNIANTVKNEQEQIISEYKRTALSLINQFPLISTTKNWETQSVL